MTLVMADWLLIAVTKALTLAKGAKPFAMTVVAGEATPVWVIESGCAKLILLASTIISLLAVATMSSILGSLTVMSATFELAVVEVAVMVPLPGATPVENPALKVPLYLPKPAEIGLAIAAAAAVVPEAMFAKAAATSLAVMLTRAVKVKPLTVMKSFGLNALNVTTLDSVVAVAAP